MLHVPDIRARQATLRNVSWENLISELYRANSLHKTAGDTVY